MDRDKIRENIAKAYWESEPAHMAWERIECSKASCYTFAAHILAIIDPLMEEAKKQEKERIKVAFLKYLTIDSETHDARRKEFNQAIFDAKAGWAVFNGTDLDMVMEKFNKALSDKKEGE